MPNNPNDKKEADKEMTVPRDIRPDDYEQDNPPAAGSVNIQDEDYAPGNRSVLPGSASEQVLDNAEPHAKEQLRRGSAGDPARPSKDGIEGTPIPRRGSL